MKLWFVRLGKSEWEGTVRAPSRAEALSTAFRQSGMYDINKFPRVTGEAKFSVATLLKRLELETSPS